MMWEGLIILGLAAAGCVTAITLKALSFAQALTNDDRLDPVEEDKGPRCDDCGAFHDPFPECPFVAAGALSVKEVLCKNCKHRNKDYLGDADRDVCLASPSGDPHPVTGEHEKFYYCKTINKDKRCPKFQRR